MGLTVGSNDDCRNREAAHLIILRSVFFSIFYYTEIQLHKCPEIRNVNILRCKYTVPLIVSDDIGLTLESLR